MWVAKVEGWMAHGPGALWWLVILLLKGTHWRDREPNHTAWSQEQCSLICEKRMGKCCQSCSSQQAECLVISNEPSYLLALCLELPLEGPVMAFKHLQTLDRESTEEGGDKTPKSNNKNTFPLVCKSEFLKTWRNLIQRKQGNIISNQTLTISRWKQFSRIACQRLK